MFIGSGIDGSYWPWDCVRGFLGLRCGGVIGGALWRRRGRGMRLFRVLCFVVFCCWLDMGNLFEDGVGASFGLWVGYLFGGIVEIESFV